jgi:tRNA 5-methylaminomethyl-2-thiouridine biosynthesis bifunctional protein
MKSMNSQLTAVVIGGGIAGCSTAHALAKRGVAVTLIERHTALAQEASGNPVAMLYPKLNTGVDALSILASHGFSFTVALLKQLPHCESLFALCGQIQLEFNQREQKKQSLLLDTEHTHLALQHLSIDEASEIANTPLLFGGLYLPEAGWVNPQQFCQALIQSDLITCQFSTTVASIQYQSTHWQIRLANKQSVAADMIVLCNANAILQFAPCQHLPITPVRGQVNFFKENSTTQAIRPIICSDHYLSPSINGMHSIGTTYAPNDLNATVSTQDTEANLQALKSISPAIFNSVNPYEVTGRVAWRSATRDYLPLAGQFIDEQALKAAPPRYNDSPADLPWLPGLYVNAGHGSKGMITAPLCGELIANLISNEPFVIKQSIATALNPSRFLLKEMGLKQIAQNLYDF